MYVSVSIYACSTAPKSHLKLSASFKKEQTTTALQKHRPSYYANKDNCR